MTTTNAAPIDADDISPTLYRRLAWRLLPLVGLCYAIAVIDRVNVGFAKLQMSADIGLSAAAYGLGAGIFFLAYCLLEIPSNLVLERVGARVWITRIMVTWGAIVMLTAFVQTPAQFYLARVALGAAEAGFYPGMVLYLSTWFPRARLTRALALLVVGGPVASVVVGPLSGTIMGHLDAVAGLAGWQWLFLVQGAPAVLLGIAFYLTMSDRPSDAAWLSADEKDVLEGAIAAGAAPADHRVTRLGGAVKDGRVWLLGLCLAGSYLGIYAVIFWMPTMIQASGLSNLTTIGWLAAIPFICAAVVTIAVGSLSDRTRAPRRITVVGMVAAAGGLVVAVAFGSSLTPTLLGLSLAASMFTAVGPAIWAIANEHLRGSVATAAALALINSIASVGSFLGPYVTGLGQEWTGSVQAPLLAIAAVTALLPATLLLGRRRPSRQARESLVPEMS